MAGIVTVNNEYYMPLELLQTTGRLTYMLPLRCEYETGKKCSFERNTLYEEFAAMKPVMFTLPGLELGVVQPDSTPVTVQDIRTPAYQYPTVTNALYTLGGRYPMVRLKSLGEYYGYREAEDGIHLCETQQSDVAYPAVKWEEDLAGQAVKSLRVKDTRATLLAFHNYLINTMTHSDFMDNAYFQKNDPQRYTRIEQMQQKYALENNQTLASRYGVCQNYAELFQAVCFQAGIPCERVISYDMDHVWNRVWLWGQWYHVDVTFDDPGPTPSIRQTYFLVPAARMMNTHYWEGADSTYPDKYDPAWEKIDPKNLATADEYRKCFIAQLVQGKTTFSLRPATAEAYGGYQGPSYWAMNHCSLPGWGLAVSYKYNAKTGYTYTVKYR